VELLFAHYAMHVKMVHLYPGFDLATSCMDSDLLYQLLPLESSSAVGKIQTGRGRV
jgi:hypothetical protein